MIKVGIECEQLEGKRFGVGHTLAQFLYTLTTIQNIEKKYLFVLYFKTKIPDDSFLENPLFEKKVLTGRFIPKSFNIFYHILLPWQYIKDALNLFYFPSYMLPALFFGKAVVVLVNDIPWEVRHGNLPLKYRISYAIFCLSAAKRACKIMTISDVSAHDLQKYYHIKKERLVVNPWGIDPFFHNISRTKEYYEKVNLVKKKLHIDGDFFLSVGQAFPRRHIKEAMLAFASIAPQYPDIQYVVNCTDKYIPLILKDLAQKLNKEIGRNAILYTKTRYVTRDDLLYLFNETKAVIYISDREALGLPPLEALFCHNISIVADMPISREIFGDIGFFIASPIHSDAIAIAMSDILNHPEKVTAFLKEQIPNSTRYDWNVHTKKTLDIFEEIVEKS